MTKFNTLSFQKGDHNPLGNHFNSSEFDCPCDKCTETIIAVALVSTLSKIRDACGIPLIINSGYRCQHHQDQLSNQGYQTAKGISTHTLGYAADIKIDGKNGDEIEKLARDAGFMAVGVAKTWCHVDVRNDKIRRWIYS